MMPSRRRVLGFTAGALATASGCIAAPVSGGEPTAVPDTSVLPEEGKTRGEADPITVERAITDSDQKYIPSNDTVRYPATMSGGEVEDYGYVSFETWTDIETLAVAARAIRDRFQEHFENTNLVSVRSSSPRANQLQVYVFHRTEVDDSGDVVAAPAVSVSALADATPRSVTATVEFQGQTATRTHPAYVGWGTVVPTEPREEDSTR